MSWRIVIDYCHNNVTVRDTLVATIVDIKIGISHYDRH